MDSADFLSVPQRAADLALLLHWPPEAIGNLGIDELSWWHGEALKAEMRRVERPGMAG